ncbi:MAG: hypothetical protein ABSG50_05755 [Opitutaceae bacterium]
MSIQMVGRRWYIDLPAEALVALARESIKAARRLAKIPRRQRRGQTLRPGPDTPLWNELARAVESHLNRRGEKVRLARLLGITRQRLHLLIVAKTAYPDAERALLLLVWLQARRRGRDLT